MGQQESSMIKAVDFLWLNFNFSSHSPACSELNFTIGIRHLPRIWTSFFGNFENGKKTSDRSPQDTV